MHQQRGPHCHQPHLNPAGNWAAQEGVGGDPALVPVLHGQGTNSHPTRPLGQGPSHSTSRCFRVWHPPHRLHTWPEDAPASGPTLLDVVDQCLQLRVGLSLLPQGVQQGVVL